MLVAELGKIDLAELATFPLFSIYNVPLIAPAKVAVCIHNLEALAQRQPIRTSAHSREPLGEACKCTTPQSMW